MEKGKGGNAKGKGGSYSRKCQQECGEFIAVENKERRPGENGVYIALLVEDVDGKNERCLLFTEIEIADMENVVSKELMPCMKKGVLYPFHIAKKDTFLVRCVNELGGEKILRISPKQLSRAEHRAAKNPEDSVKKSFLVDLFD